jgi:UDP-N-acetylglucosamine--N-acetylmuramyl-(pentapeptide) pyrophosphoryl-undecaprenol N-acetylglucosamine transferase
MKVMMAGGGTGGHVYPALAVAEALRRRDYRAEILFVGTKRGLEARLVPEAGYTLRTLPVRGVKGLGTVDKFRGIASLPESLWVSRRLLEEFRPNVVFGTGGYAAGPTMLQAVLERRPTVIFEPNAEPGLTNRLLGPLVTRVAVTYNETAGRFGPKAVWIGSPVRKEFLAVTAHKFRSPRTLLIFGGSRGALKLNRAVLDALTRLQESGLPLCFIHQTGEDDYDYVREGYKRQGIIADVRPFIDGMADIFEKADLIICRAGASTVAELTAAGRAAILVPFPYATDHHQLRNAEALERAGAACLIEQGQATGEKLAAEIIGLLNDPEKLEMMSSKARGLAVPDAADRIVDLLESVAR